LAATIRASGLASAVLAVVEVAVDTSLAAFSNSFLASPIDLANSGSFCGPQRKITTSMATTISHS